MTNAEFLAQSPAAFELLEWLGLNPGGMRPMRPLEELERVALRELVKRGLVTYALGWPVSGWITTRYKITVRGWLAWRQRAEEVLEQQPDQQS